MSSAGGDLGEWLRLALPLGAGALIYWILRARGSWRRKKPLVDDSGEPYQVYTQAFDRTLAAKDVPAVLDGYGLDGPETMAMREPALWAEEVAASRAVLSEYLPTAPELADGLAPAPEDWAICILIDQSGSMRGDSIRHAAAATKWLSDHFTVAGARVSMLGFTTLGWRGGEPRQQWLKDGRPQRPGRLCALLHTVYQDFAQPLAERDWEVMLRPDMLRENVDGEALEWAYGMLKQRSEPKKLLLVISDGAPVDDSTYRENGDGYMVRHLQSVIEAIELDPSVDLIAFGIGFDVSRYYRRSESAKELAELPEALSGLITKTIAEMVQNQ